QLESSLTPTLDDVAFAQQLVKFLRRDDDVALDLGQDLPPERGKFRRATELCPNVLKPGWIGLRKFDEDSQRHGLIICLPSFPEHWIHRRCSVAAVAVAVTPAASPSPNALDHTAVSVQFRCT